LVLASLSPGRKQNTPAGPITVAATKKGGLAASSMDKRKAAGEFSPPS
jgi:hypothetical protein